VDCWILAQKVLGGTECENACMVEQLWVVSAMGGLHVNQHPLVRYRQCPACRNFRAEPHSKLSVLTVFETREVATYGSEEFSRRSEGSRQKLSFDHPERSSQYCGPELA